METLSKPSERWNPSKSDIAFSGRMLPLMHRRQVITSPRSKRTKVRIRTGGMTEEIIRMPLELK